LFIDLGQKVIEFYNFYFRGVWLIAPGNRTPLVKVVEVKLLVTYLIFQLSVTHIGRTEERKLCKRGNF